MLQSYIALYAAICIACLSCAKALQVNGLLERALADSPNGYVPQVASCGAKPAEIRKPFDVSPEEKTWLEKRRPEVASSLRKFIKRTNISNFDSDTYLQNVEQSNNMPVVSLAMSGGGYRALLTGAGALAAFDDRTRKSTEPGHLGGLLQSATYVSGLSGGGWLVGSIYANNFTSVEAILDASAAGHGNVWNFNRSIIEGPPNGIKFWKSADYWKNIYEEIKSKKHAGFNSSITDYWARGLSFQLINATDGGASYTFSSIAKQPGFPDGKIPMPIIVATSRDYGQINVSRNTTVFEFNPFEMGSWDPFLWGMAPMQFVGSKFEGGTVSGACTRGFDNLGFVMGTSSSLWNEFAVALVNTDPKGVFAGILNKLRDMAIDMTSKDNDIANWSPNPFYKWNEEKNKGDSSHTLTLADGGEDYQNIPLYPHIQPPRKVDVIFAVDSSADHGGKNLAGFPNGTALIATYERHRGSIANGTVFPAIPDWNTFVNLGLSTTPTFFGCDSKNISGPSPLIVYVPNAPYTIWSNLSTETTHLKNEERANMIQNGYNVATMGNGTLEKNWPACVGCAVLARSFERSGTIPPKECQECFTRHCWNGTLDTSKPNYAPKLLLKNVEGDQKDQKDKKKSDGGRVTTSHGLALFVTSVCIFVGLI